MENNLIHIIDNNVFSFLLKSNQTPTIQHNPSLINSIAILGFDDDIGQLIEQYYPLNCLDKLSLKHISSIGFPETNPFTEEGELIYIFNMRKSNLSSSLNCISIQDQQYLYCYTYFIQRKTDQIKRGYMQKSLVIISEIYRPDILLPILKEISELYKINHLSQFTSEIIRSLYSKYNTSSIETGLNVNQYQSVPINSLFENLSLYFICKITALWELIITETPLVICANDPSKCSNVVMLLSSLIYPLEYSGDIRPYFSIYDSDFKEYRDNNQLKKLNTPILGVINPICSSSFSDWIIIHFDDFYYNDKHKENPTNQIKYKTYDDIIKDKNNFILKTSSKMKFALQPNQTLIKSFYDFLTENDICEVNKLNIYLRMYLIELNNDFLRTFESYFFKFKYEKILKLSFMKDTFSIYEIFNQKDFIGYINEVNKEFDLKYINDKKKTNDLYKRFIQTKGFNGYLKRLLFRIKTLNDKEINNYDKKQIKESD